MMAWITMLYAGYKVSVDTHNTRLCNARQPYGRIERQPIAKMCIRDRPYPILHLKLGGIMKIENWGLVPYSEAWERQTELFNAVVAVSYTHLFSAPTVVGSP